MDVCGHILLEWGIYINSISLGCFTVVCLVSRYSAITHYNAHMNVCGHIFFRMRYIHVIHSLCCFTFLGGVSRPVTGWLYFVMTGRIHLGSSQCRQIVTMLATCRSVMGHLYRWQPVTDQVYWAWMEALNILSPGLFNNFSVLSDCQMGITTKTFQQTYLVRTNPEVFRNFSAHVCWYKRSSLTFFNLQSKPKRVGVLATTRWTRIVIPLSTHGNYYH